MRAMALTAVGRPLEALDLPVPAAGPGERLLQVRACAVCRTDLHLLDGEVTVDVLPRVLGHQVVGVDEHGDRYGVPWLGWTCGTCRFCRAGEENLCPHARFTGRDRDGGFAEWIVADERFCFPLPDGYPDAQAAPLLCAGLIGHRALRLCGPGARRIGFYGFGAAAHVLCQVVRHRGGEVVAFVRPGDHAAEDFARGLGAVWAGPSDTRPEEDLDAAIVFAPDGALVPLALRAVRPGGVVVCGGIHMSDIPSFPYADLWQERTVRSVANLTRSDGHELLALAPQVSIETTVTTYPLEAVNTALDDLRHGRFSGAAVVVP